LWQTAARNHCILNNGDFLANCFESTFFLSYQLVLNHSPSQRWQSNQQIFSQDFDECQYKFSHCIMLSSTHSTMFSNTFVRRRTNKVANYNGPHLTAPMQPPGPDAEPTRIVQQLPGRAAAPANELTGEDLATILGMVREQARDPTASGRFAFGRWSVSYFSFPRMHGNNRIGNSMQ
jgi:hypothetical protein